MNNNQFANSAPSVLRLKTSNAFQIIGTFKQKQPQRTMFVSGLTGIGRPKSQLVQMKRNEIKAQRAHSQRSATFRNINNALGGGNAGKIQIWGNGAISVNGKLTKNPLK